VSNMLDDASQVSLTEAEFRIDKSLENRGLTEDLSYELVKRDWTTWGIDFTLGLEEMVNGTVVHQTNNLN